MIMDRIQRTRLKPEPLHHDQGVLAIGVILVKSKHRAVPHALVESLCPLIGDPHFQLDTGGKLKGELVLCTADKEVPDTPATVPRADPDIADVPVDMFPGILKAADNESCNGPVADRYEIRCRVIRQRFEEDRLVPGIDERFLLDKDNGRDIRGGSAPYLWQGIGYQVMGTDHEDSPAPFFQWYF